MGKVRPFVFYSTDQDREVQVYERNLLRGPLDKPLRIKNRGGKEFVGYGIEPNRRIEKTTDEDHLIRAALAILKK